MATSDFGEKLRHERESRQTPIEEIAGRSKIDLRYLQALELGDFDALPGPAIGKYYLRVYAEYLGFAAEEWIAEYDRVQNLRRRPAIEARRSVRREPRRVEAALARWREARAAERAAETAPAATSTPATEPEAPPPEPTVEPPPPPVEIVPPSEPTVEPPPPPVEIAPPVAARRPRRSALRPAIAVIAIAVGLGGALIYLFSPGKTSHVPPPVVASTEPAGPVLVDAPLEPAGFGGVVDEPKAELPVRAEHAGIVGSTAPDPLPGALTVTESGVGRAVADNRLLDHLAEFQEGSAAYFFTRVLGGAPGQTVRHVWIRDGHTVQTIELPLGGAHWRTHSRKTLYGLGPWVVEARDADERLLARVAFTCVPKR